jgi:hypothetical protein
VARREQALYRTDINRFLIHRFDPRDRSVKSWFFDEPVTTIVLTGRDDTLAVALGARIILWNPFCASTAIREKRETGANRAESGGLRRCRDRARDDVAFENETATEIYLGNFLPAVCSSSSTDRVSRRGTRLQLGS